MKLYITTHDDYDDQWGASICSLGVFDSYDEAEKSLKINGVDFFPNWWSWFEWDYKFIFWWIYRIKWFFPVNHYFKFLIPIFYWDYRAILTDKRGILQRSKND